jgi:hypothetical protein
VADEDHGVIGPHVGIGLFLLGDRDAALAHCVQREARVIFRLERWSRNGAPLGTGDEHAASLYEGEDPVA